MTNTVNLKPASERRVSQLPQLFSAFVETLPDKALTRLYHTQGRIWLDSGSFEFRISYGPPESRRAHSWMHLEPSIGLWVYQDIHMRTHTDHPSHGNGGLIDWVPSPEWVRGQLLESVGDLAENMRLELEEGVEMAERWLNSLVKGKRPAIPP